MSFLRLITFVLLITLCSLPSLVESGLIGIVGTPVEAAWCGVLGKESSHCPTAGGGQHGGGGGGGGYVGGAPGGNYGGSSGSYNGHRARRFA
ncbi:hypothetical protein niasHT_029487 [Heterodera trifolii]|uniref:Glycine-rich protein n=1 Tax=Heterodera trifolii TaxID=157864 RepID=A0ABD2K702_9BILA